MYYYARLICKASVYKLFSELFLATSCLLYADTVPLSTEYTVCVVSNTVLRNVMVLFLCALKYV